MFEEPPIVYPAEPSSLMLMATGILTLACYLVLSGKWREIGLPTLEMPVTWTNLWVRKQAYGVVDYELRFASMTGGAVGRQTLFHY
jgi:hypothetical protein